jgi:hypothetical protein
MTNPSYEQYLTNRTPRETLQEDFIERILDGMTMDELVTYAYDTLSDYYNDMSDEDLKDAVKEEYPDLLENK